MDLMTAAFWIAVLKIILIDILLSGDNAVVIAGLPQPGAWPAKPSCSAAVGRYRAARC